LVPHCDVLTVEALALAAGLLDGVLLLAGVLPLLLLHPARAIIPLAATSPAVALKLDARPYIRTCPHLLVVKA
jgi:hypothetical protein